MAGGRARLQPHTRTGNANFIASRGITPGGAPPLREPGLVRRDCKHDTQPSLQSRRSAYNGAKVSSMHPATHCGHPFFVEYRFNMRGIRLCLLLICLSWSSFAACAGIKVVYPAFENVDDTRFDDLVDILKTALEKTTPEFGPFELEPSKLQMDEVRYMSELKAGKMINIAWSSTSVSTRASHLEAPRKSWEHLVHFNNRWTRAHYDNRKLAVWAPQTAAIQSGI